MSSWRLHMSDVENEKSEGLAYTMVFKGKHTFQKTYTLNLPGGLEFGPRAVSGSVYRGAHRSTNLLAGAGRQLLFYFYSATVSTADFSS